jgi:hypothetical protein
MFSGSPRMGRPLGSFFYNPSTLFKLSNPFNYLLVNLFKFAILKRLYSVFELSKHSLFFIHPLVHVSPISQQKCECCPIQVEFFSILLERHLLPTTLLLISSLAYKNPQRLSLYMRQ